MTPEDALPIIAEISIGLAGFTGLVAAFGQRAGSTWRGEQKARIVFMIVLSFGLITASLLPFALSGIRDVPAVVWGGPMVGFGALNLLLLGMWTRLARRHGYSLQFPVVSRVTIIASVVLQVVMVLSGLGALMPYAPGLFVLGQLSVLLFCANLFLALLQITWSDESEEAR